MPLIFFFPLENNTTFKIVILFRQRDTKQKIYGLLGLKVNYYCVKNLADLALSFLNYAAMAQS